MLVLVYGGNGWIGKQFLDILYQNKIDYLLGYSRVDNIIEVKKELQLHQPTHIVSFIGRTHGTIDNQVYSTIDYLEQPNKLHENIRDNLFSPLSLAILCNSHNIHLTYLGTGCIFNYDDIHPYGLEKDGFVEDDIPNFYGSSYSIVKGFTDRLMHLLPNNILNLRIRMPINTQYNSRNFITKITNYKQICSIPNSMSILPDLLPIVLDMMTNNITGTINLTNPGLISHNEILELYQEIVDPSFQWENFTLQEQDKILDSKRSNNYLDTSKLQQLYPHIKSIKTSIKDILLEYKTNYLSHINNLPPNPINMEIDNKPNIDNNTKTKDNDLDCIHDDLDGKRLLVTGGCGFIGSNFINTIMKKYTHLMVYNIDALYYCANENNIDIELRESNRYQFIKGNICSMDLIQYILSSYQITHIIHFAAQSHVQNSFTDALQYTNDNILGTHHLLEAVRLYGKIERFIHVSTDEVYGESILDSNENKKTETSILIPTNPYAATKAGAELLAQSYIHSFNLPIIITRGNNVYGPNQYPEKVIPRFILLLQQNKKITIQGDGSCVRGFLHSIDTSQAFIKILERGEIGEIYNIGCDEDMEYSIMDVAKKIIYKIKNTTEYDKWIEYVEDRPFNDKRYYISNQKLLNLGWKITISLDNGLNLL